VITKIHVVQSFVIQMLFDHLLDFCHSRKTRRISNEVLKYA